MTKGDLHLYGLTVIYLSSKIEDVEAIGLSSLIIDAGHAKFKDEEIIKAELDILKLLQFKLYHLSVLDSSLTQFSTLLIDTNFGDILKDKQKLMINDSISFVSHVTLFKLSYCSLPI